MTVPIVSLILFFLYINTDDHQVMTSNTEKEPPKFSGINISEKPHRAPKTSLETEPRRAEISQAHTSDLKNLKLERIPEALEKPTVKEPSRGFKRLLKLGRKNYMSAAVDQSGKPDDASVNDSELSGNATHYAASSDGNAYFTTFCILMNFELYINILPIIRN